MAGGKVREWIRKRTMPRKAAAGRRSSVSGASMPILKEAAGSGSSAIGAAPAPIAGKAARSGASGAPAPARLKVRTSTLSSVLRWLPRVNMLAVLYEKVVYHLLWLVESVVVVARLCFFVMRFGFKQL